MKTTERKLTAAESKRQKQFETKAEELLQRGYQKKDLTISVFSANLMALIVMLPLLIPVCLVFYLVHAETIIVSFSPIRALMFVVSVLILCVIHESVHGIVWAYFSKHHFRDIEFGVIWSMLTPYCTCKSILSKQQYIIGAIMPTIVVGIIPAAISIIFNHYGLFLLSLLMIAASGGDGLIVLKLLFYKENGNDCIYMDHPYECGLVVFERVA